MRRTLRLMLLFVCGLVTSSGAQPFVHPGGLHNREDLERMRTKVAAREHPWIDGWEKLCADPLAQFDYKPTPAANMGVSRQRASRDAHAAYLNTLRWHLSGDDRYADCAIRICDEWSRAVDKIPSGQDIPGLSAIPIAEFALVGELLRDCPRWQPADFDRFKRMMRGYWYPNVHAFLTTQNGPGNTRYWANWNIANIGACLAIGVLLDDRAIFNEGLEYFHSDLGTGSIKNAVYFIHPDGLGQWQESGRDQPHAQLGVGLMAQLCEVAWKQGIDLYGAENNRLLAGAEYVAQWDLWKPVPYKHYTNSDHANQSWPSINGRGRLNRPVWELLYNHYVVRKGLSAPNTTAFANLTRVEGGSVDHFGYGTLTFTLDSEKSPFPPSPVPPPPTELNAEAGVGRVYLRWQRSGDAAQGYEVRRATSVDGPFTSIASWTDNTRCVHTDTEVQTGTTYHYQVAARNQAGTSAASRATSATPVAAGELPVGWSSANIGNDADASASFANVCGNTFILTGSKGSVGGASDGLSFLGKTVRGDITFTARLSDVAWAKGANAQKVGIALRQSLAPDSPMILIKLGDRGVRQAGVALRTRAGQKPTWTGGNDYTWLPAWFRLERVGTKVTACESGDGEHWFPIVTADLPWEGEVHAGLFVASGAESPMTAQFDFVSVVP